jgi:hypothetical protein
MDGAYAKNLRDKKCTQHLVGKSEGNCQIGKSRLKIYIKERGCQDLDETGSA